MTSETAFTIDKDHQNSIELPHMSMSAELGLLFKIKINKILNYCVILLHRLYLQVTEKCITVRKRTTDCIVKCSVLYFLMFWMQVC